MYRILSVELHAEAHRILAGQSKRQSFCISCATASQQAFELFSNEPFDLVLVDLQCLGPEVGLSLLETIKRSRPEACVIILAASADVHTAIDALGLGADEYLLKPWNKADLLIRVEKCLKKREGARELRRYKEIIDCTSDMVSMISPEGVFLIVNHAFAKNFSKGPDELVGSSVADLFGHHFFRQYLKKDLSSCFAGHAVQAQAFFPFAEKRPNRCLHFSYSPYFSSHGKVSAAIVTIRDITEYNRMSQDIQQNEARLRLALDASSDGVWDHDLLTGEVYYGENWARLLGYTPEQVREKKLKFSDLLHSEDKAKTLEAIHQYLSGKTDRFEAEFRLRTRQNDWCWILARGKVVAWDNDGRPARFVGTHTEITAKKKAELELRKLNAGLEKKVANNTARLAGQKADMEQIDTALTVLAKKREQDRDEIEEQMLANIKMLVVPWLQKLQKSGLDKRQQYWLDVLQENIEGILSPFAQRLSAGHLDLTPTEIQIVSLIIEGKTTKEMAEAMDLSPETISNHRKHIRRKIGLTNKKINLRTALTSLPHF